MLGHYPNVEKTQLARYVEDYLECVESLPLDIQRNVSLLREIDTKYQDVLKEVDDVYERYRKEADGGQRKRLQTQLQRALISSQELGDEKIHVVAQMTELVENRARHMDAHTLCHPPPVEAERSAAAVAATTPIAAEKARQEATPSSERSSARRPRRHRNSESRDSGSANGADEAAEEPPPQQPRERRSKSAKKKKRSKAKAEREASPAEFTIDPDEPTYCLCDQVSYGEMIGCDNEQCPIEWFHFSCVGLTYKPKGKWYCPKCRGDSEKTMDKSGERTKKDRRSR